MHSMHVLNDLLLLKQHILLECVNHITIQNISYQTEIMVELKLVLYQSKVLARQKSKNKWMEEGILTQGFFID